MHEELVNVLEPLRPYDIAGKFLVLNYLYGPAAAPLRCQIARRMHADLNISKSDKRVQWGNFRSKLLEVAGITGTCKADEDHQFNDLFKQLMS